MGPGFGHAVLARGVVRDSLALGQQALLRVSFSCQTSARELAFVVDDPVGSARNLDGVRDLTPGASTACTPVDCDDDAVTVRRCVHLFAKLINRLAHTRRVRLVITQCVGIDYLMSPCQPLGIATASEKSGILKHPFSVFANG